MWTGQVFSQQRGVGGVTDNTYLCLGYLYGYPPCECVECPCLVSDYLRVGRSGLQPAVRSGWGNIQYLSLSWLSIWLPTMSMCRLSLFDVRLSLCGQVRSSASKEEWVGKHIIPTSNLAIHMVSHHVNV